MPKKKGFIWDHYHQMPDKSTKCNFCSKVYKIPNVNKMGAHLKKCYKCPIVIRNKLNRCEQENSPPTSVLQPVMTVNSTTVDTTAMQLDDSMCSEPSEFGEEKRQWLTKLLSKAIFVSGTPLSMVEHPLWKQFFEESLPLLPLPTRKAVSTTHLETIYKEMDKEITEELKSSNYLHLQCDGWSNRRNEGIIHFIIAKPEPFFVKSLHTGSNRHTGEYLSDEIEKVLRTYGSEKFVTLIGDNAKNIQKAFDLVTRRHPHIIGLSCAAHTLNLLCHDVMKPQAIQAFISIAIDTIKVIKRSQILSALLSQLIREKGAGERLKLPSKTRWGSYLFAIRSLLKTKNALQALAVHEEASTMPRETKTNLLDETFWKMTEECIALIEPITENIFKLEGNKNNINLVYMAFKDIHSRLLFILPDLCTLVDSNVKERILSAVDSRRNNCIKPIHFAAYMLDPKTQGVELEEDEEVEAMDFLHTFGCRLNLEVMADLANYRAKEGLWGKSFVWSNLQNIDAVIWWKGICKNRPLSKVALRLLTAPCTSAATERSFSTHGNIHSLKRNRLTTDRAAKLAFISYNWNLLHKNEIPVEEDDDEESGSTSSPLVRSELNSPTPSMDQQPSTSRGPAPIQFIDIESDGFNSESDSD